MSDENKEFKKAVFESDEQTKGKEEAREEMVEDIVEEIREEQALPPGFTRVDPPLRFRPTSGGEGHDSEGAKLRRGAEMAVDKPRGQARIAAINEFLEEHYGFMRDDSPDKVIVDLAEKLLEERGRAEVVDSRHKETIARLESRVAAWRRLAEDLERMRTPVIHHTQEKQFK